MKTLLLILATAGYAHAQVIANKIDNSWVFNYDLVAVANAVSSDYSSHTSFSSLHTYECESMLNLKGYNSVIDSNVTIELVVEISGSVMTLVDDVNYTSCTSQNDCCNTCKMSLKNVCYCYVPLCNVPGCNRRDYAGEFGSDGLQNAIRARLQ